MYIHTLTHTYTHTHPHNNELTQVIIRSSPGVDSYPEEINIAHTMGSRKFNIRLFTKPTHTVYATIASEAGQGVFGLSHCMLGTFLYVRVFMYTSMPAFMYTCIPIFMCTRAERGLALLAGRHQTSNT